MLILACRPGSYGKNCMHDCSKNCYVTSRCDNITGECKLGCKPGWDTITCDKGKGFYLVLIQAKADILLCFQFHFLRRLSYIVIHICDCCHSGDSMLVDIGHYLSVLIHILYLELLIPISWFLFKSIKYLLIKTIYLRKLWIVLLNCNTIRISSYSKFEIFQVNKNIIWIL